MPVTFTGFPRRASAQWHLGSRVSQTSAGASRRTSTNFSTSTNSRAVRTTWSMADETPVLIRAGERRRAHKKFQRNLVPVAAVTGDSAVEDVPWKMSRDLGEDQAAGVHRVLLLEGAVQGG